MMASKNDQGTFESRLNQLEALVSRMEEGGLTLEQLMKSYEEGNRLSSSLSKELEAAQERLMKLKGTQLEPVDESE